MAAYEYTDEEVEAFMVQICDLIAGGESFNKICRKKGMPARATVRGWINDDRLGFAARYQAAMVERTYYHAEEMIEIADAVKDAKTPEQINAAKLRIHAREWNAARMNQRVFGDKVKQEIGGPDGGALTVQVIRFGDIA